MKKYAFTLAELLVSTLIISIIMVVLAPVITKRVTSNINVSGGGGSTKKESKLFLYNPTDPNCSAVSGQNALDCNFTTGSGVKSVNVVMVSGGGGGAGGTPPTTEYGKKLTVTNSAIGSAKTQEITITKNMKMESFFQKQILYPVFADRGFFIEPSRGFTVCTGKSPGRSPAAGY